MKNQREIEREEYKKRKNQERELEAEKEVEDEDQKAEPITLQITETRTRSDKVEPAKQMAEKPKAEVENKQKMSVLRKMVPPGPGQYTLPNDV